MFHLKTAGHNKFSRMFEVYISHSLISQDVFKAQKAMHKQQVRYVKNAKDPTKRADR